MNALQQKKYNELLKIATENGLILLDDYKDGRTAMNFKCIKNNHIRCTRSHRFKKDPICFECNPSNKDLKKAKENFKINIEKLGGQVIGEYVNNKTSILCICKEKHECTPTPNHVQKGQGMCIKCANLCPIDASKRFIENIEKLGGHVIGQYINCYTPVKCVCIQKHECYPSPTSIQQGQGMCLKCAENCPIQAENNFRQRIDELGGIVIGNYINNSTPVECLCKENHINVFLILHIFEKVVVCVQNVLNIAQ